MIFLLIDIEYNDFIRPSNSNISFQGDSGSTEIIAQNSYLEFKARRIDYKSNLIVFRSLKNVKVSYWSEINYSNDTTIQVESENPSYQMLNNAEVKIFFTNLTLKRSDSNRFYLEGYMSSNYPNEIFSHGSEARIINYSIDSISTNSNKITDFRYIEFEMDNKSYVDLFSGLIKIDGIDVSEFEIQGKFSRIINEGEGKLNLNDNFYGIQSTESIDVIAEPNYDSNFKIRYNELNFIANTNNARKNKEDIIKAPISYWFDQKTEKTNALLTILLLILNLIFAYLTYENLKLTKSSTKQNEIIHKKIKNYIMNFQKKHEKRKNK